jgi:hypothetical protein
MEIMKAQQIDATNSRCSRTNAANDATTKADAAKLMP